MDAKEWLERTVITLVDLLVCVGLEHLDREVIGAGHVADEGAETVQPGKHAVYRPGNTIHCNDVVKLHVVAVMVVELALPSLEVLQEL